MFKLPKNVESPQYLHFNQSNMENDEKTFIGENTKKPDIPIL